MTRWQEQDPRRHAHPPLTQPRAGHGLGIALIAGAAVWIAVLAVWALG